MMINTCMVWCMAGLPLTLCWEISWLWNVIEHSLGPVIVFFCDGGSGFLRVYFARRHVFVSRECCVNRFVVAKNLQLRQRLWLACGLFVALYEM